MPIEDEVVDVRSGTAAEWAASSLVLGAGELAVVNDTGEVRVGDGTNAFSALRKNPRRGTTTLVAGTKVVNDATITTASIILVTVQSLGTVTAPKAVAVTARVAGTSFTVTSSDNTDTSVVGYEIREP
jgi:hypothetical protein